MSSRRIIERDPRPMSTRVRPWILGFIGGALLESLVTNFQAERFLIVASVSVSVGGLVISMATLGKVLSTRKDR